MKKILLPIGIVAIAIAIVGYVFLSAPGGEAILADSATIRMYSMGGGLTDYAFTEISFKKNVSGDRYVNIFADVDKDNVFGTGEWIVQNEKAVIAKDYANRFSFTRPSGMQDGEFILSAGLTETKIASMDDIPENDRKKFVAPVNTTEIDDEFGLNVPGASPDLKRGVGLVETTFANDFDAGISGNIPDLTGGPMDCFAIATANNLIKMAEENGRRSDLPQDPQILINELKLAMQYNNGIINRNFLTGKNAYVTKLNFPVTTREIRRPTKADIDEAFTSGDAVEISTTMLRSKSGKGDTGHVLTGVGASQDGDELGIAVHDPATPAGADTFLVSETAGANPYLMINYPLWDGIVIIDAVYIQTWTQPVTQSHSSTYTQPASSEAGKESSSSLFNDGKAMEVIEYDDTLVPISGLRVGSPHPKHADGDGCPKDHWHADKPAKALNEKEYPDPNAGGCGFGTLEARPVMNYFPHDQLGE